MSLHLIKLSVGSLSVEGLESWQNSQPYPPCHVTRMWPKRAEEIAGKGSIYWVINGEIQARQLITKFAERIGDDQIRRCAIMLDKKLIRTRPTPRRPFQGWRYLKGEDAPADLSAFHEKTALPEQLERVLNQIGVGD